jgi:glycosyltransferase involved in cell wall biosynthesis
VKLALITNIPAPYRIPIFNRIAAELGRDFLVIFCARLEPDRNWDLCSMEFDHVYLKERYHVVNKNKFVHNNPDVLAVLRRFRPDVVVTSGFNPTHLLCWLYTLCTRSRHVPMTDGWLHSERGLSRLHRMVRRGVFRSSRAFLGASNASLDLFRSYGIDESHLFQSHLCIDNDRFTALSGQRNRKYDLMYSGQIVEGKLPDFFVEVVGRVKKALGTVSVLVIGDGPRRKSFLDALSALGASVSYAGFVRQDDLPAHYCSAKLLLFTTRNDAWGIVANEALASGTPVITTPYAGVAGDLVLHGVNGYVLNPDAGLWAGKIVELLRDDELLEKMSRKAVESVGPFNFQHAAEGILSAARHALVGTKCHCR